MRSSMELGGNAPFIVLADADIEKAVDGAMKAKMRNMGEACTAANRFFVAPLTSSAEFSEKFAKKISELQVGNGALARNRSRPPDRTEGPGQGSKPRRRRRLQGRHAS